MASFVAVGFFNRSCNLTILSFLFGSSHPIGSFPLLARISSTNPTRAMLLLLLLAGGTWFFCLLFSYLKLPSIFRWNITSIFFISRFLCLIFFISFFFKYFVVRRLYWKWWSIHYNYFLVSFIPTVFFKFFLLSTILLIFSTL